MDNESYSMIEKLNLENVTAISLSEFEDEKLLQVKDSRTPVEYCWTISSSLPLYIFKKTDIDMLAYVDADLYFYSSPEIIYDEFGSNSVMIIPHRFFENIEKQEKNSGIYNVGMLIFRNNEEGLTCLNWWRERCLEWCFNRIEDGKLGDQAYLNDWPVRFKGVCVLANHGANVAPWNSQRYSFFSKNGSIWCKNNETQKEFPLIFYHFHSTTLYLILGKVKTIAGKHRPNETIIYKRYQDGLSKAYKNMCVKTKPQSFKYGFIPAYLYFWRKIKNLL
jgi:hypothetical protein